MLLMNGRRRDFSEVKSKLVGIWWRLIKYVVEGLILYWAGCCCCCCYCHCCHHCHCLCCHYYHYCHHYLLVFILFYFIFIFIIFIVYFILILLYYCWPSDSTNCNSTNSCGGDGSKVGGRSMRPCCSSWPCHSWGG
jgi:hypothetical protein